MSPLTKEISSTSRTKCRHETWSQVRVIECVDG